MAREQSLSEQVASHKPDPSGARPSRLLRASLLRQTPLLRSDSVHPTTTPPRSHAQFPSPRSALASRQLATGLAFLCLILPFEAQTGAAEQDLFRFAFSTRVLGEVEVNDGRAAAKAWARSLVSEFHLAVDPEGRFLEPDDLRRAIQAEEVDGVTISLPEYLDSETTPSRFERVVVSQIAGAHSEEYLVLARRNSDVHQLADLKERRVMVLDDARMCLAHPWLEVLLREQGLPPLTQLARSVASDRRLARVVLPVFFNKAEVAVVSRNGFQTMVELNPQVGQQLAVIATSPPLIPVAFFFRRGFSPGFTEKLIRHVSNPRPSAGFQQILRVFRADSLAEIPLADLEPSLALLRRYRELRNERPTSPPSDLATRHTAASPGSRDPL